MITLFAQAPAQAPAAGSLLSMPSLLMFGGIFAIMYFMLIRPQQKQIKQQQAMLSTLRKGDEVVLQSGIWGKIHTIEEKVVWLEFSNGTKVKVERTAIIRRIEVSSPAPFEEEK
ncbi:MAG: preprotein translocase subunit YajC [Proteobacteria bacterium]|nr:preprotein translocase subunit YajC [Cystobacterineae bacterium]MCL2259502.1 preprotein translocase subunit YajC [Cystobacterineae bacterium]MCL2314022.1 preprotein translocase subunit YajC [Pseudomonadota bacterium]